MACRRQCVVTVLTAHAGPATVSGSVAINGGDRSITATPESRLARDDTFRRGPGACWAPHSELASPLRATPKLGARARSDSYFRQRSSAGGWLCCPPHWFDVPYREADIR